MGSTFTRVVLLVTEGPRQGSFVNVELALGQFDASTRILYNRGEFPTAGLPFDKANNIVGTDAYKHPDHCSLKYFIYVLANTSDRRISEYPHFKKLFRRKNNKAFLDKLKTLMKEFFIQLQSRINNLCEEESLAYREIALSIPVQWEKAFQVEYEKIVRAVFNQVHPDSIFWVFEPESIAHYVLGQHKNHIFPFKHIIIFDFGGHSMVCH